VIGWQGVGLGFSVFVRFFFSVFLFPLECGKKGSEKHKGQQRSLKLGYDIDLGHSKSNSDKGNNWRRTL